MPRVSYYRPGPGSGGGIAERRESSRRRAPVATVASVAPVDRLSSDISPTAGIAGDSRLIGSPPSFGALRGRLSSGSLTPEDISTYLNFVGDDPQSAVNNLLRSSGYNLSNRFVGRLGRNLGRGSTFALLAQALGGDVRPEEERNRSILESILGGAGTSTYTDPSYFTNILGQLNSAQRQIGEGGVGIPDAARAALESFYSPDFDTLTSGGRNLFAAARSASTPAIFRQFAEEALRRQTESWEDFLAPQNPSFNLLDYLTGSLGIPY